MRFLTTASGLIGGICLGILLFVQKREPTPVVVGTVLVLAMALCGVVLTHGYLAFVALLFRDRKPGRHAGAAILSLACLTGAVPAAWVSDGSMLAAAAGGLAIAAATTGWLTSQGVLAEALEQGVSSSWKLIAMLFPVVLSAIIATPLGLVLWISPLVATRHFAPDVPSVVPFWCGTLLGCLAAGVVGTAIGRMCSRQATSAKKGDDDRPSVPSTRAPVAWATVAGVVFQVVIFYWDFDLTLPAAERDKGTFYLKQ